MQKVYKVNLPINTNGYLSSVENRRLDGAKLYVGKANKDPREYPIKLCVDGGMTVYAPPYIAIKNGWLWYDGDTTNLYTDEKWISFLLLDVHDRQLLYKANIATILITEPKFASHPYPFLSDTDAYSPTIKPLNITLKSIVTETDVNTDAYSPTIKPLDATLKSIVTETDVNTDAYSPTIKPLNITLKNIVTEIEVDTDAYSPTIKPLDIVLERIVVRQYVDEPDVYSPKIKPLDIIMEVQLQ